jgi:hypothetical protein
VKLESQANSSFALSKGNISKDIYDREFLKTDESYQVMDSEFIMNVK